MANPPPVAVQKKKGLGCCGCGCLVLGLLVLLFLGGFGLISYELYHQTVAITSPMAADIPSFDGGNDAYTAAQQKLDGFTHDVNHHLPASIQLSADEINTLIAHNPDYAKNKIHAFVTMENDQARVQASLPTGIVTDGLIKDRYLNGDVSFSLNFDPNFKTLNLSLQNMSFNGQPAPAANLPSVGNIVSPALTVLLEEDSDFRTLFQQAKTIEIKNGQLVMSTQ